MTADESGGRKHNTIVRLRHIVIAVVIVAVVSGAFIVGQVSKAHSSRDAGPTTVQVTTRGALPRVEPSIAFNEWPAYKPAKFWLAADGTGYMSGITWQSWTAHRATGRGILHVRSRTLGYSGTWSSKPSGIVLSEPVKTRHGLLFTSVRIGRARPWPLSTALPTATVTTSTTAASRVPPPSWPLSQQPFWGGWCPCSVRSLTLYFDARFSSN